MSAVATRLPPQVQQGQRPRTRSVLSFGSIKSTKSHKSSGSHGKIDLKETSAEKERSRLKSKADPTLAMNEQEPASVAAQKSTLQSLRAVQHRDANGNLITDPDRSNPTRNRWERPLDTIRSFEAAIDGSYHRRRGPRPPGNDAVNGYSRRSSYHQNYQNGPPRSATDQGYYGNRMPMSRPESYADNWSHQGTPYRPRFAPRVASDSMAMGNGPAPRYGQPVYPTQAYQRSYDTVTSVSNSGSNTTEQWGNSTDPSSENSSVDRIQPAPKPDLGEAYGFNGFGEGPALQTPSYYGDSADGSPIRSPAEDPMAAHDMPPQVPPHLPPKDTVVTPRVPIKLGNSAAPVEEQKKRKSWFKRFSKS